MTFDAPIGGIADVFMRDGDAWVSIGKAELKYERKLTLDERAWLETLPTKAGASCSSNADPSWLRDYELELVGKLTHQNRTAIGDLLAPALPPLHPLVLAPAIDRAIDRYLRRVES